MNVLSIVDEVEVISQHLVGGKHLKLSVPHAGTLRDAIWVGRTEPVAAREGLAYRPVIDEYLGRGRLQVIVEAVVDLAGGRGRVRAAAARVSFASGATSRRCRGTCEAPSWGSPTGEP